MVFFSASLKFRRFFLLMVGIALLSGIAFMLLKTSNSSFFKTDVSAENGACGAAAGQTFNTEPSVSLLCISGTPTNVSASSDKWLWQCSGRNGGTSASCQANKTSSSSNNNSSTSNTNSSSYHYECRNRQCVEIPGAGATECLQDVDCEMVLEKIYVFTNPFNDLSLKQQVSNGTVVFTAQTGQSQLNWHIRGTAGGTLNSYTGSSVTYTPAGNITGQDIVSVSDGVNKSYAQIKVDLVSNKPIFNITLTNVIDVSDDFPVTVSAGLDLQDSLQLKAMGEFRDPLTDGTSFRDITSTVDWKISDNDDAVGTLSDNGLFQPKKVGTIVITAEKDSLSDSSISSNAIKIFVNPTFPDVNPPGYTPYLNPNPVAKGYSTRLWVFVDGDSDSDDIRLVSADLSRLNISPICKGENNTIENCGSAWRMTGAEFENSGRWYYMEFRVPFTVAPNEYPIRIQATSTDGDIDRSLTVPFRVVNEVPRGDVSGDGIIMIQDAIFALQAALGTIDQTDRRINVTADVDGDGRIGLAEAIHVLNALTQ